MVSPEVTEHRVQTSLADDCFFELFGFLWAVIFQFPLKRLDNSPTVKYSHGQQNLSALL